MSPRPTAPGYPSLRRNLVRVSPPLRAEPHPLRELGAFVIRTARNAATVNLR